jgi:hypothetical protein
LRWKFFESHKNWYCLLELWRREIFGEREENPTQLLRSVNRQRPFSPFLFFDFLNRNQLFKIVSLQEVEYVDIKYFHLHIHLLFFKKDKVTLVGIPKFPPNLLFNEE